MIRAEDVADLREGDVVELTDERYPGVRTTGPLRDDAGELLLGAFTVRAFDGLPAHSGRRHLTVVSRAPRPLYVNHPRTNPALGDVVRLQNDGWRVLFLTADGWLDRHGAEWDPKRKDGLLLLVDGESGEVVP